MNKKKVLLLALMLATGSMVTGTDAAAATISQPLNFAPKVIIPQNTTSVTNPNLTAVAFNQFDASLGTLNGVTWTFTGTASYFVNAVGATYEDPESGGFTSAFQADLYSDQSATVLDTAGNALVTFDDTILTFTQVPAALFAGESTNGFVLSGAPKQFSGSVSWPASGTLAQFIGTGSDELFVDFFSRIFPQSTPFPMTSFSTKSELGFTSTLTFDYTPAAAPVPVPAGLWLLASGLAAFHAASRRRTAAA
jgi:hypothetical protein